MRRKGLLLVISLLALATLMAAMSFSSATVQAKANLSITNQADGLVGLLPGDGTTSSNGDLLMDFTDGTNDKGIQPGSVYTWDKLFIIKNNSKKDIVVNISDMDGLNQYVKVNFTANGQDFNGTSLTITPGEELAVNATIDATGLGSDAAMLNGKKFTIKIDASQK